MEVGGGGGGGERVIIYLYIPVGYTLTTRMTSALRWAATMRAILMFLYLL